MSVMMSIVYLTLSFCLLVIVYNAIMMIRMSS